MKNYLLLFGTIQFLLQMNPIIGQELKTYYAELIKEKTIDSNEEMKNSVYADLKEESAFFVLGSENIAEKQTAFRAGYQKNGLRIAIRCAEPEMSKIKCSKNDMENVWDDDCVEVFIWPTHAETYYHFVVNAKGSRWSGCGVDDKQEFPLASWSAKTLKKDLFYFVEMELPWDIFLSLPQDAECWKFNIGRHGTIGGTQYTTWSALNGCFHEPDHFGKLVFAKNLPDADLRQIGKRIAPKLNDKSTEITAAVEQSCEKLQSGHINSNIIIKKIENIYKECQSLKHRRGNGATLKNAYAILQEAKSLSRELDSVKIAVDEERYKLLLYKIFNDN